MHLFRLIEIFRMIGHLLLSKMLSLSKFVWSEYSEKTRFWSFNLNNSEKHRLSFEGIVLGTLDTYTKKNNPPSAVLGGGWVHDKVCCLIV